MKRYVFADCLAASLQQSNVEAEIAAISAFFPDAVVEPIEGSGNDGGIDYVASLGNDHPIRVDAKRRTPRCGRYWQQGEEELALELWSDKNRRIVGWTLDPSKRTEYVLFTFDPTDSMRLFLIAFQLLRRAFQKYGPRWSEKYRRACQDNGRWISECVFVPVSVVRAAVHECQVIDRHTPFSSPDRGRQYVQPTLFEQGAM